MSPEGLCCSPFIKCRLEWSHMKGGALCASSSMHPADTHKHLLDECIYPALTILPMKELIQTSQPPTRAGILFPVENQRSRLRG